MFAQVDLVFRVVQIIAISSLEPSTKFQWIEFMEIESSLEGNMLHIFAPSTKQRFCSSNFYDSHKKQARNAENIQQQSKTGQENILIEMMKDS